MKAPDEHRQAGRNTETFESLPGSRSGLGLPPTAYDKVGDGEGRRSVLKFFMSHVDGGGTNRLNVYHDGRAKESVLVPVTADAKRQERRAGSMVEDGRDSESYDDTTGRRSASWNYKSAEGLKRVLEISFVPDETDVDGYIAHGQLSWVDYDKQQGIDLLQRKGLLPKPKLGEKIKAGVRAIREKLKRHRSGRQSTDA